MVTKIAEFQTPYYKVKSVLKVKGELTQIGDQSPYFSITADEYCKGHPRSPYAGGCMHEDILKHFPGLKDFVLMHLSDIDGKPMHAIENGWYWLTSSLGENFAEYTDKDPEKSFGIFCKHCRISEEEGKKIQNRILKVIALTPGIKEGIKEGKNEWIKICSGFYPRWKKEADMLIEKYHLIATKERF